jgi:phosphoglycolate phosphatase
MSSDWHKPYQTYLFDLDGTLIDTAPDLNVALNHCLARAGLAAVDESLTRHWVGHGARVMIQQALDHQQASHDTQPMLDAFILHYEAHSAVLSKPYPQVLETLDALKASGAKLGVVTNKLARLSERLLSDIGMRDYFDVVVGGDTTPTPKPHPAPVLSAMDALNADKAETLFVGDSETDVRAAQAARIPVVCLRDGYNHGVDVKTLNANAVIDSFAELL